MWWATITDRLEDVTFAVILVVISILSYLDTSVVEDIWRGGEASAVTGINASLSQVSKQKPIFETIKHYWMQALIRYKLYILLHGHVTRFAQTGPPWEYQSSLWEELGQSWKLKYGQLPSHRAEKLPKTFKILNSFPQWSKVLTDLLFKMTLLAFAVLIMSAAASGVWCSLTLRAIKKI